MSTPALQLMRNLALICLLSSLGCVPTEEPGDDDTADDDDSAAGDDDTAGDDDDAASNCEAPGPPYTIEFSGDYSGVFVFDDFACTDYNGDEWSLSYVNASGWQLRVVAGPLVEGETLSPESDPAKIDITLQNNSKQAVYSGRLSFGHVASIDVQRYQSPSGPCGYLSTEPLLSPGGSGGSISLGPQPLPFNCSN